MTVTPSKPKSVIHVPIQLQGIPRVGKKNKLKLMKMENILQDEKKDA